MKKYTMLLIKHGIIQRNGMNQIMFISDPLDDKNSTKIKGSTKFPGICINNHMSKKIPKNYQLARLSAFRKHFRDIRVVVSTDD